MVVMGGIVRRACADQVNKMNVKNKARKREPGNKKREKQEKRKRERNSEKIVIRTSDLNLKLFVFWWFLVLLPDCLTIGSLHLACKPHNRSMTSEIKKDKKRETTKTAELSIIYISILTLN